MPADFDARCVGNFSRREFLNAAGAAAVLAATAPAPARAATTQTLKIGLIGCGNRGTGAVVDAIRADSNTVLTAVADLFPDRIEKGLDFLKRLHPDHIRVDPRHAWLGFDAYQKVIDSDVDIVLLATPPAFRPRHLKAAIEAGKHAFAECIAGVDAPGVRSFLQTSERAAKKNLGILSGFCWRYDAGAQAAHQQIRQGAIGSVRCVYATFYRFSFDKYYGKERHPAWTDLEWQLRDWPDFLWLGGDLCIGLSGGHSADKIAWWLGDEMPIKAVGVGGREFPGEGNTFDHCLVAYEYADGKRAFLGVRCQNGCHEENADYIIGADGVCTLGRGPVPVITGKHQWKYSGPLPRMHQVEHEVFLASIRAGKPINDGPRMARTTMMTLMGRMAAYTGQEITWEQAFHSQQSLVPDEIDWHSKIELTPLPRPGVTKFF